MDHHIVFTILESLGVLVFAISGIRLSANKFFDWFGGFVVGFATAVSGGTLRDLLLGAKVFWIESSTYFFITGIALLSVLLFRKFIGKLDYTFFIFDSIGLGLFVIVGFEKALYFHQSYWIACVMGIMTGVLGGIVRDILINELPIIFRREIYALACFSGCISFIILDVLKCHRIVIELFSTGVVIAIRFFAVKYKWKIPMIRKF
ncbi:MAG: trimeric intracellular cation channel family protein [Chitinophagaceae bacterium]